MKNNGQHFEKEGANWKGWGKIQSLFFHERCFPSPWVVGKGMGWGRSSVGVCPKGIYRKHEGDPIIPLVCYIRDERGRQIESLRKLNDTLKRKSG